MPARRPTRYYEKLGQDFFAAKKVSPGRGNELPHIHDQYELLFCLSDGIRCEIDTGSKKNTYSIRRNTLLIFNNMDQHHVYPSAEQGENIRYVVYFDPAFIDSLSTAQVSLLDCFLFRPFQQPQILPVSEEEGRELQQLLDKLIRIQNMPREECYGQQLYLQLLLAELLLTANRLYRLQHRITTSSTSSRYRSVYAILSYIHTHYDEPLSLDLLASQFFMNKFYLCEVFKKVTGQTPSQYIINCRLARAKELLRTGHLVEDVCAMAGFNNMSHFSRTFKNRVGVSPKRYQKEMLGRG